MLSPRDEATVRVDVFPLVVRMPEPMMHGTVRVFLNGTDITDPYGLVRTRWAAQGAGAEYLATLDLGGVAAGHHLLRVEFTDESGSVAAATSRFTWRPYPCPVRVSVRDETGAATTARVVMYAEDQPLWYRGPNPGRADPMDRDKRLNAAFVEGERTLYLPRKDVTLLVTRGLRYGIEVIELPLSSSCDAGPSELHVTMAEEAPTPGRITADLHVHTAHSRDSFTPDRMRQSSLAAADLDLIVFSEHNRIWDPTPMMSGPLQDARAWAATEARVAGYSSNLGHYNVYPLSTDAPSAEEGRDLRVLFDRWRARQRTHPVDGVDRPLIQLNHPRGIQLRPEDNPSWRAHAVFSQGGFDRTVPVGDGVNAWMTQPHPETGTTILDFDVLEVLNRFSWEQYQEVRQDWFLLLDLGRRPTGVGNSDSHAMAVELLGYPVNLVSTAGGTTTAELVATIDQGNVTVSSGPIVELTLNDSAVPGDQVSGATHQARVHVHAATWVPATEVRLVIDGDVTRRAPLPAVLPPDGVTFTWPISVTRDAWVIAEAGWPPEADKPEPAQLGNYARVAPGYIPVGFTNPIWVDADEDGRWRERTPTEAAARTQPLTEALQSKLGDADLIAPP